MKGKTANAPFRAEDLIGKTWMYRGIEIQVIRLEADGLDIVTDRKTYRFSLPGEVQAFVKECLPIDRQPGANANLPAKSNGHGVINFVADTGSNDLFEQLLGELKEDFDTMKNNPDYVPRAKQRANHINAMANLAKLRLQMEKLNKSL